MPPSKHHLNMLLKLSLISLFACSAIRDLDFRISSFSNASQQHSKFSELPEILTVGCLPCFRQTIDSSDRFTESNFISIEF